MKTIELKAESIKRANDVLEHHAKLLELAKMELNEINILINCAEEDAKAGITQFEKWHALMPFVKLTIDEKYTYSTYIKELIGLYIQPSWQGEFNAYTAQFNGKHSLWYAIRDNISDFYTWNGATINKKGDIISFHNVSYSLPHGLPYDKDDAEKVVIKRYQNRRIDVVALPIYMEIRETVKSIYNIFN